jgi:drug/metabolite transporter (DMT)-like permease
VSTPSISRHGIVLSIAAMGFIAAMDSTNKLILMGTPLLMALWSRYMIQALAMTGLMLRKEGLKLFNTQAFKLQTLRAFLLLSCSFLGFKSLEQVPVAEFTAIAMVTPLLVTILARIFMKEHVSPMRWFLVVLGLMGALLIVRPGGGITPQAALYPLGMAVSFALFQILTSHMSRTEDPMKMHLFTGCIGALITSIGVSQAWSTDFDSYYWWLMLFAGAAGTSGHFLLILAYQSTKASLITPFLYSSIAFATLFGWLIFTHIPDAVACMGIALIVMCGIASAWISIQKSPPLRTSMPEQA